VGSFGSKSLILPDNNIVVFGNNQTAGWIIIFNKEFDALY
jgi:hypothetical protein